MPMLRGGFMMDQQNNKPNHVPTEEEIARMEAEAARHLAEEAAEKPGGPRPSDGQEEAHHE